MIKLFNYELSFRREITIWAYEEKIHVWEYIFRIEKVTEYESKHRKELQDLREKGDNPLHTVLEEYD